MPFFFFKEGGIKSKEHKYLAFNKISYKLSFDFLYIYLSVRPTLNSHILYFIYKIFNNNY